ncbi:MAG: dienelactone hydrolase family protein [Actinomycetota bacterium]|nr:dienelactone hydrolase family protein [Actinomycetota bacterium]
MSDSAGSAYLVAPPDGPGRGVLVLHSWWGLTSFFRRFCDRLADEGYTALAPDLLAGETPATPDEAEAVLAATDPNAGAGLVLSSARALRSMSVDPAAPIAVIGFSMGASWGLWLSARSPTEVDATVAFYGTQSIDFEASTSAYLGHYAEYDALVSDDEVVELEAHLRLVGKDVTFHRYPGTSHWFFEEDRAPAYDPVAAELAWQRTIDFLAAHLGDSAPE